MHRVSIIHNVPNVPSNFCELPFGRQLEYRDQIEEYKKTAKQVHLSQKRRSYKTAIKEFKALYQPSSYYIPVINVGENYFDDSFLVFYTV